MIETVIFGFLWYQFIALFGLSIGLHRYFCHRQFKVSKTYETFCLFLAMLAGSRSPLGWIGLHRIHHRYADTKDDPHSPDIKGFWNIVFNNWTYKSIPRIYLKDLLRNPRVMFFHKHWKKLHISLAILTFIISVKLFIIFIVFPFVLGNIGYGLFNALGHKEHKPVTNMFINLLSAGEGYHDVHHNNPRKIRLNKFDLAGWVIERFFDVKKTRAT